MPVRDTRRSNLKLLLERLDSARFRSLKERAAHYELDPSLASQILNDTRGMGDSVARRLEKKAQQAKGWMDLPHPKEGEFETVGQNPAEITDFSLVPLYEAKAAAGGGAVVTSERVVDTLAFRADFLRKELNAGKDDLYLIRVEGDSMEPTLRAGDVILVDHRRQVPDREGIYVIRMEDALLVKRIQLKPGGKMVATSDNTNYKDFELSAKTPGLAIIGRVVWAGRRF